MKFLRSRPFGFYVSRLPRATVQPPLNDESPSPLSRSFERCAPFAVSSLLSSNPSPLASVLLNDLRLFVDRLHREADRTHKAARGSMSGLPLRVAPEARLDSLNGIAAADLALSLSQGPPSTADDSVGDSLRPFPICGDHICACPAPASTSTPSLAVPLWELRLVARPTVQRGGEPRNERSGGAFPRTRGTPTGPQRPAPRCDENPLRDEASSSRTSGAEGRGDGTSAGSRPRYRID